jgi:hypothetical protein
MESEYELRNRVIAQIESKHPNWTKKWAAIDSLWWSLKTDRPRDEAIRGLANATTCGTVPSYQDMCQAEKLYDEVA